MNHSNPCIAHTNTHHKQSLIRTRISAIVSSVIALLCASALILSPNTAFAADGTETNPPSSGTSEPGGSSTPQTPASPSAPNSNTNTEPTKPTTPAQPAPSQQNGTLKEQTPRPQTTTAPRSSNNSASSSRRSTQSSTGNSSAQDNSASTDSNTESAGKDAEVTIAASTPVVTSNSGYHLNVAIKNTGSDALPAGTLTVAVNDYYTFASRSDLQQWAQGNSRIQVPNQIGQVNVPTIAKGEKTSVTIDANPDQPSLKNMLSWGPKPLRIDYSFARDSTDSGKTSAKSNRTYLNTTHTFLTRSSDGLKTANTPPMDITIAMPLTSDEWQVDGQKLTQFMTAGEGDTAKIVNAHKLSQPVEQLISKHPGLQVITDPTLAQSLPVPPKSSGIMQSGDFDITAYSAINDGTSYEKAGIAAKDWNSETALKQYRDAVGDAKANMPAYAWPGRGHWTINALETARAQGYSTVIEPDATGMDDGNTNSTIRTGKYTVHTSAGDITVLTAQNELSRLAQGKPTDKTVDGESSPAGRLARFMAQSAFYQMESPYATRNLLICFNTATANSESNAQDADTLMQTVEQAPWLKLNNIGDLNQAKAYLSGDKANALVPGSPNIHASTLQNIRETLATLAASKNDIDRFNTSILDESSASANSSSSSAGTSGTSGTSGDSNNSGNFKTQGGENGSSTAKSGSETAPGASTSTNSDGASGQSGDSSKTGGSDKSSNTNNSGNASSSSNANDGNAANGNSGKVDTGDAQSLARQDADATAKRSKNGCDWIAAISSTQSTIALHALSRSDTVAKHMVASAQNLASQLMNGIKITPSESITVLSESAKMPVTVSNNHPYPVTVKISSLSDSMEIVTTRFATLSIPARSEAQTTFNVRVSTSGTATARLTLTDRRGDEFSTPQSTRITSTLRLSDMSGMIFIAIALVLGVLGLWRQFNRKKDPDE
ncbi:DUF6049 family protein [Bifidobacterium sp. ESL0798]|uniref:DUF6049 family protein n=1 Tax=Bifidobacterium sp. ESL0798 TaxID=2983235 RepID=UPI0023F6A2B3|nr:DUF6049 family protein [Bifidobacterium sp. ESL0798]WEV74056.1 DUF6049 family protein [Bifidobacterium sp. ESL0798]